MLTSRAVYCAASNFVHSTELEQDKSLQYERNIFFLSNAATLEWLAALPALASQLMPFYYHTLPL